MTQHLQILLITFMCICMFSFKANSAIPDLSTEELLILDVSDLFKLAKEQEEKGRKDQALLCYLTIIDKLENSEVEKNLSRKATAYVKAGIIYFSYGDFSKSLQFFHNSLGIYQGLEDQDGIANLINNLGTVYHKWEDFDNALLYYSQANELFHDLNLRSRLPLTYNNLGALKIEQGDNEQALELLITALEISEEVGDSMITNLLSNIGVAYQNLDNYDQALYYYREAYMHARKFRNANHEVISLMNMAMIMRLENQFQESLNYLFRALDIAQKEGFRHLSRNIYFSLHLTYEEIEDHQNSLSFYRKFLDENEFVFNTNKHRELREIQVLHEVETKNNEIQILTKQTEMHLREIRAQQKVMILFGALFFIILIFILIFSIQKKKQKDSFNHLLKKNKEVVENEIRNQNKIDQLKKNTLSHKEKELQLISETRKIVSYLEKHHTYSYSTLPQEGAVFEKTKELYFNLLKTLVPSTPDNLSINPDISSPPAPDQLLSLADYSQKNLARVIQQTMENEKPFLNCDFSLEKLSLTVGSNKKYVSQVINEEFKKGFNHYVNEYRILEARKMLTSERYQNYTFEAIANEIGFRSRSSFNSAFKMFTGQTPSAYKKAAKLALFNKKRKPVDIKVINHY